MLTPDRLHLKDARDLGDRVRVVCRLQGPVSSALSLIGCGAYFGYMQEEPRNNSRGTRAATAASSRLTWIWRFSDRKSTGRVLLAMMPPTLAAASMTT